MNGERSGGSAARTSRVVIPTRSTTEWSSLPKIENAQYPRLVHDYHLFKARLGGDGQAAGICDWSHMGKMMEP